MMELKRKDTFSMVSDVLVEDERYKELNGLAILLYSFYARRLSCSINNAQNGNSKFVDPDGTPFIFFTNEEAAKKVRTTARTVSSLRKELVKYGLITVKRYGLRHYKIYVHEPQATVAANKETVEVNDTQKELAEIVDTIVSENISCTSVKNVPTSEKYLERNTNNITRETNEPDTPTQKSGVQPVSQPTEQDLDDMAIKSLEDKVAPVLTKSTFGRIKTLSQGSYRKAKWFVDTIFKAKSQVESKLLSSDTWLYSPVSSDATRFETNELLSKGLESALLQIAEHVYRGKETIRNAGSFIYVYIRNFMASAVRNYIKDNYELVEDDEIELNMLMNFRTPAAFVA